MSLLRRLLWPVAWVALAVLSACQQEAAITACTDEEPCPPPPASRIFAAQLLPGAAADRPVKSEADALTPQEVPQLSFDSHGGAQLRFGPAAQLRGVVVDELGAGLGRSRVIALLPSQIPGQPAHRFETSTDPLGAFTLRLPVPQRPAEQPYRIWVGFDDPEQAALRPPMWRGGVVLSGDLRLVLQQRKPAELVRIRGRVLDLFGAGVPGMRVQVMDSRREVVSSTVQSRGPGANEPVGSFQLVLDPALTQDEKLQVVAWPTQPGLPIMTQTLVRPAMGTSVAIDMKLPPYRTPAEFTLALSGTGSSGGLAAVPGARVVAQAFLDDPLPDAPQQSIFIAAGETDDRGHVRLMLVPASVRNLPYTVTVQSPAQSQLSSGVFRIDVGTEAGVIALPQLGLRAQIGGRLLDSRGRAVARAQVRAISLQDESAPVGQIGGVLLESATPQTTTDADGRFALRLDQGDYHLDIVPVPGTQPRYSLDNQRIFTDDIELGVIHLPGPTLGRLQVLSPLGAPVPEASLRIFEVPALSDLARCDLLRPCSGAARLRVEVSSDDQGRAEFLLPDAEVRP